MKLLHKLIIIVVFTSTLLSGCRTLKPADPLIIAEESTPPTEVVSTSITTPPSATIEPAPVISTETTITTTSERIVKPQLNYTVSDGELLWSIAKRPDIYGDPLLWPLIYQANRDQIKDPRKIYAGQILSIPRNTSESEREEARNRAKKSNIFSPQ